ncbi:MAG TPA: Flp pilus assembly protein CpaB [Iamia sp.]|nr:Flp pilus assembly protein CpaB [Iamia sp.]
MKRSNLLIGAGVVLVVLGIGLAWAVADDDGEGDGTAGRVPVLVAVTDLEPGQAGDDLVATGKVRVERVEASEAADGALRATTELTGTILGTAVPEGRQVVAEALRSSALRGDTFTIPDGQEAVAVTVPFTAGVAGYVGPGDRVNVYASITPDTAGAPTSPRTELLLGDVEVLDVSDEIAPRRAETIASGDTPTTQAARDGAREITLLLAVDPAEAEQVVFATTNNQLWLTLVPEDGGGGPPPPGVDYGTYGPAQEGR